MIEKYELLPLFHTPLYMTKVDIANKETQFILNSEYEDMQDGARGQLSKNKYILDKRSLSLLKKQLDKHIIVYTQTILKVDPKIKFCLENSWIIKHDPKDYARLHFHSNTFLSGVIYVQVPPNSGDIIFSDRRAHNSLLSPIVKIPYSELNIHNATQWSVKPEKNLLLIFPASLQHWVSANKTEESRYGIAFNYGIKGTMGSVITLDLAKYVGNTR